MQRLPWVARLQAVTQRSQPFLSHVFVIPRTPLGLPTDSSVFILPKTNEKEYTEHLNWHAQGEDQSGSHHFCHIPVVKAGPMIVPHFSGTGSALPNSVWGTGVNTG